MFPVYSVAAVSQKQVDLLWRPSIGFINTDDIQHTEVDEDSVTTILRHDNHHRLDFSNPYEGQCRPNTQSRHFSI